MQKDKRLNYNNNQKLLIGNPNTNFINQKSEAAPRQSKHNCEEVERVKKITKQCRKLGAC